MLLCLPYTPLCCWEGYTPSQPFFLEKKLLCGKCQQRSFPSCDCRAVRLWRTGLCPHHIPDKPIHQGCQRIWFLGQCPSLGHRPLHHRYTRKLHIPIVPYLSLQSVSFISAVGDDTTSHTANTYCKACYKNTQP